MDFLWVISNSNKTQRLILQGKGFGDLKNLFPFCRPVEARERLITLEGVFHERILFLSPKQGRVGMGKGIKISILNRDKKNILSWSEIGDGPLDGKLAKKPFHLFSAEMKSDESRRDLSRDRDGEPLVSFERFSEQVDDDGTFLLNEFQQQRFSFGSRSRRASDEISLLIVDLDRGGHILFRQGLEVGGAQGFFPIHLIDSMGGLEQIL